MRRVRDRSATTAAPVRSDQGSGWNGDPRLSGIWRLARKAPTLPLPPVLPEHHPRTDQTAPIPNPDARGRKPQYPKGCGGLHRSPGRRHGENALGKYIRAVPRQHACGIDSATCGRLARLGNRRAVYGHGLPPPGRRFDGSGGPNSGPALGGMWMRPSPNICSVSPMGSAKRLGRGT
jgi:hypothetical protein